MAQQQRVRVTRGFRHKAEIVGPGSVLDLDKSIALELRSANKLEFVDPQTKLSESKDLPDPNAVLAQRRANRAAANAATEAKATKNAAAAAAAGGSK
jgi:hypothetical protein